MASPAAGLRRHHSGSFSEHSRLLQPTPPAAAADARDSSSSVHGKMNYQEAVFNAINVLLGVGVLSSPFALRSSGLLIGVPLFFFFTLVTNHTGKLLGYCLDYQEGMQVRHGLGGEKREGGLGHVLTVWTPLLLLLRRTQTLVKLRSAPAAAS